MELSRIMKGIKYDILHGNINKEISDIFYDSRQVNKSSLFVCITGFKTDGHIYADKAVENGAEAIVCEHDIKNIPNNVTIIKVENSREALASIAVNFYDNPAEKLNVIGVTGTNGKTTTTYLIKSILDKVNHKVGIIGTIENRIGDEVIHTERTTPESIEIQKLFKDMQSKGVDDVVMEVSSHSLDLYRVDGCNFNIGIFTNLTQDHLDYHITFENYRNAKSKLFKMCKKAVVNIDDATGNFMIETAENKPVITFGIDNPADLRGENIYIDSHGVKFELEYKGKKYPVELNIPGKFSIYNALGSIGACIHMGIPMEKIIEGLKDNKGVKGRFQTVASGKGFNAIVDYAHTPDGLENILITAHEFTKGRIITVFGCGGDRDKTKRPIMGEIAGKLSDYCIITSDNPRTENPLNILDDVEKGMIKTNFEYIKIADRKEAIFYAVKKAEKGDIIIIAGKGHEDYQIFPDKTIHFDDVEIVKEAFEEDINV